MVTTPESDLNSNSTSPKFSIGGMVGNLNCSINSSHDFSHDNSDYQWFVDYGCKEGFTHQSVLSSLCESYNGLNELSYYDDIAKHLDANLAEVDIDSFRAEDMNSLLSKMPKISKADCSEFDNSIYKSELLFSPIKESHISIDSLDLESYQDTGDMILTCKANKNNYTIAFEGSILYSDESFYADPNDVHQSQQIRSCNSQIGHWNKYENSMTKSAHSFTTWSKLKKSSTPLHRYPSGNNNTSTAFNMNSNPLSEGSFKKSSSLPNIKEAYKNLLLSSVADKHHICHASPIVDCLMCHVTKSTNLQNDDNINITTTDCNSESISTEPNITQQPAFNLVKLFIEQKSSSSDTCMDFSSGCWPSTDGSSNSSIEKERIKKKIMKDSGKSSSICRNEINDISENDEQSFQLDSLDICDKNLAGSKSKVINEPSTEISQRRVTNHHLCNIINNNYFNNKIANQENKNLNSSVDLTTKSIQTSSYLHPRLKFVPPSFLANLNKLGDEEKAPVYVIYPNYALPDLNFVNPSSNNSNIIYTSYKLKSLKPYSSSSLYKSHDDIIIAEDIRTKHIKDWNSLIVLLPPKYRKKLKHIPEANVELDFDVSLKPMFCMSPPIIRNSNKSEKCDCIQYLRHQNTSSSISGSSDKPPSSGYRGSSTIMTDSELNFSNFGMKNKNKMSHVNLNENTQRFNNVQKRTPRSILRKRPPSCSGGIFEKSHNSYDRCHLTNVEKRLSLPDSYMYQGNFLFLNDIDKKYCNDKDEILARIRAENFLSNIPKSELKYYEEIAHILNCNEIPTQKYDSFKLKTEVSKALSQKRVSFTEHVHTRFSTPPNSPNISVANMRVSSLNKKQKSLSHKDLSLSDQTKIDKISSNRFKRLQIQWELLSKESSMLFELANENHTKSGGSTPVNDPRKSKIPRPVSHPSTKSRISSTLLQTKISSLRAKNGTPTRLPSLQPKTITPLSRKTTSRSLPVRIPNKIDLNAVNSREKNISEKQI